VFEKMITGKYMVDNKRDGRVWREFKMIHIQNNRGPIGNIMLLSDNTTLINTSGRIRFHLHGRQISKPDENGWITIE
jgi:hypothetical protein